VRSWRGPTGAATGIELSRSTVQRMLRGKKPKLPKQSRASAGGRSAPTPRHVIRPKKPDRTWHLDLTILTICGIRFHIAGLLDGFSRKLHAIKVYARTPTALMMAALVKRTAKRVRAAPRFVVTDHGTQFMQRFERLLSHLPKTTVVRCRVHDFRLNGKIERFFRTFKFWARRKLFAWLATRSAIARSMQRKCEVFREWYNLWVNQGIGGRTPNDVYEGKRRPKRRAILANDPQPLVDVTCHRFRGDHLLPVFDIQVDRSSAA